MLEINEAGSLHGILQQASNATFAAYPDIDMRDMPNTSARFDVVVHSGTLEHVPHPVRALTECHRVLKPGGALCLWVPMIVGRLIRRRDGTAPSHHGTRCDGGASYAAVTKYGADMQTEPLRADFASAQIFSLS